MSNSFGSATSAVASVTVVFPPTITIQPLGQTLAAGASLALSVSATGTAPLSYQWLKNSAAITGASNSNYTPGPVQTNDAGSYVVIVSNPYSSATSAVAVLTVYVPVSITTQPISRIVPAGAAVSFAVSATGYPAPTYQWSLGGVALPGATRASLTITNVRLPDLGNYAVLAANGYSSELSAAATLSMSPSITAPFAGATAVWGRSAVLSVGAIGSGSLRYQWYKDRVLLGAGTNSAYNFGTVQLGDGGFYAVVVSSPYGSVTNTAQLIVNPANIDLGLYAGITINGAAGYSYNIQYTTDLTMTNSWVSLTNLTLPGPVELWVDMTTNAAATHRRFYRVVPGQ